MVVDKECCLMLFYDNKEKVLDALKNGDLISILSTVPKISDEIFIDADKKYNIIHLFNSVFPSKSSHVDALPPSLFLSTGVLAMLNNFHAFSSFPIATTNPYILNKLGVSITSDKPLYHEKSVRNFSKKYKDDEFQTYLNDYLFQLFHSTNFRHMHVYSYDCSEIPVCFTNVNYENSTVITSKKGGSVRGYKLGFLRGILPSGDGFPCEIKFGSLNQHDLTFSKDLLINSKWFQPNDILLLDRCFIDYDLLAKLNERGISVIIPAKKSMDIFQTAVECAESDKNWFVHPNKKRKHQKINLVKGLETYWTSSKGTFTYKKHLHINACVIRHDLKKEADISKNDKIISTNKKYAYSVILTTNLALTANEIITLYEQRWGSEEDFRQLKCYWDVEHFTTTRYEGILLELICCVLAYALYVLYKQTKQGKKLKNHCLMTLLRNSEAKTYQFHEISYMVIVQGYYAILGVMELMKIYRHLDDKICAKIDKVLK